MLVREVTQDKEGVTDSGVHHLRYAYFPHTGNAMDAEPWKYAYEFNQPLIVAWKTGQGVNVQVPFAQSVESRELENSPALPVMYSLLSAQNAVIADLYRQGNQIEAVVLNYNTTTLASLQVREHSITLPESTFTLMPLLPSSLNLPPQNRSPL